jgi:deoxyguanosine kinase
MKPFFLAIEGPIGVGKTTLARLLQPRFKAELLLEAFEENPFLSNFYGDRARYAFQTQMFFLLSRYRQQQEIPTVIAREPLIGDYTFGKDALFARLNLEGDELDMYRRLYTVLAERIVPPDLVIYLKADTDDLMARIAARDRPYEREMDRDYIARVAEAYERHFSGYTSAPLLTVDTTDLNYVTDASALVFVEGRVRRALGIGAYQQALPEIEELRRSAVSGPGTVPPDADPAEDRALADFLAANETMARLGTLLAEPESPSQVARNDRVRAAAREALDRVIALAAALGISSDG